MESHEFNIWQDVICLRKVSSAQFKYGSGVGGNHFQLAPVTSWKWLPHQGGRARQTAEGIQWLDKEINPRTQWLGWAGGGAGVGGTGRAWPR